MKVINPATGQEIATLATDTEETVNIKIAHLREGQKEWKKVPVAERLACIVRFGELIEANVEKLAATLTAETGKPIQQSLNEIRGAHNRITHLQQNAEKWLQEESLATAGSTRELIVYEPLGVIANISAWNFPYNVGYNIFLYALVGGNAVCYKPSEYASLTGLKFREYLWAAGVPEDVFECIIGSGEVGEHLLNADLDGYFFTGSYATGKYIAGRVAPKLVPVQLELGGKDPLYIMDDVPDVKQAAINAAEGAFYNNGQSCCAVERIYVQEGIFEEFIECFIEEVASYKLGEPTKKDTFIGPLTRGAQVEVLESQVRDAVKKGAFVALGGQRVKGEGYYFEPTVLTEVNHEIGRAHV